MPHSVSIQAPTSRVVRGSVSVIQAFSRSCCASLKRHALPSLPKLASPSIPSSSYSRCQVRIVSASSSKTLATAAQLIPSSNNTSALARGASRCAADPSRASSIRSCRDAVSRKPGRIIRPVESGTGRLARGDTASQGVGVYQVPEPEVLRGHPGLAARLLGCQSQHPVCGVAGQSIHRGGLSIGGDEPLQFAPELVHRVELRSLLG